MDEKRQYYLNREAAKISTLSSGKINKYEEILGSDQSRMIKQAKFTYSPLGKFFEKRTKAIEDPRSKQIEAIQNQEGNKLKQFKIKGKPKQLQNIIIALKIVN